MVRTQESNNSCILDFNCYNYLVLNNLNPLCCIDYPDFFFRRLILTLFFFLSYL